jgi:type IV pilus assembly protein PilA
MSNEQGSTALMRATFKNYIDAEKARRGMAEDEGFSLIELIIVVVILGILVAIAIPLFINIQATAQTNAIKAAAANGATAAAASFAGGQTAVQAGAAAATAGDGTISVALTKGTVVTDVCATATGPNAEVWTAGPGASGDNKSCP